MHARPISSHRRPDKKFFSRPPEAVGSYATSTPATETSVSQSYIYVGVAGYVGRPNAIGKVGVFRRDASCGEWSNVLIDVETCTFNVHSTDANVVLTGTKSGVYVSTNRGATFNQAAFPDTGMQIWTFQTDSRKGPTSSRRG